MRFTKGGIEPIGGWVTRPTNGATILGTPNAAHAWRDPVGNAWLAVGTTSGLYVIGANGRVYDLRPAVLETCDWQLAHVGAHLVASSGGAVFTWPADTSVPATVIGTAPTATRGLTASHDGALFALGGSDPDAPWSARRVYWSDRGVVHEFGSMPLNTAGSFDIATAGELQCAASCGASTLLWTTTDLWQATSTSAPYVYRFAKAGDDCGIVGPRAHAVLDGVAYWLGPDGCYRFDGTVERIPCSRDLPTSARVWCYANPAHHEVTWHDGDRYVTYHVTERHWVSGSLDRTAGVSAWLGVTDRPVLIDASGTVYVHESGTDNGGLTPFAESGPLVFEHGDRVMRVQQIIPDAETHGPVGAWLYTAVDQPEVMDGPFPLSGTRGVRLTARSVRLRLGTVAPGSWRVGAVRLGVVLGGRL